MCSPCSFHTAWSNPPVKGAVGHYVCSMSSLNRKTKKPNQASNRLKITFSSCTHMKTTIVEQRGGNICHFSIRVSKNNTLFIVVLM